ncbi:dTMP kinase [Clostridiisalibacter paucivorans]|uniref:dTMP kinase n=1 Tax=Clostridiisalibacter paucivorans TaxID=408753 RepID=UPI00047B0164|nr:dTMP kinase [Clostridiisalibacter paucivorans]
MRGIFITIEGPDGSGKSTQIKKLSHYLNEKGYNVLFTREPGGTNIGEYIRKIILDKRNTKMSYETEALLYAASRAQHVSEKIKPALEKGTIVICDRFVHSSLVYQGIARGIGIEEVNNINQFAIQGIKPDVTLFFDISPEIALKRKRRNNKGDRLEREDILFHKKVYNGYLKLKEMYPNEIISIDATNSINTIFNEIKGVIDSILTRS